VSPSAVSGLRVAVHTDQLRSAAPGGIGTYVAGLLEALPRLDDAPEIVTFQVGGGGEAKPSGSRSGPGLGSAPGVTVPGTIRSLYPRWALTGRPRLPSELRGCHVVHSTNHAAVPPVAGRQALVVTVHDLAFDVWPETFPPSWRWLYRAGVRAAARRAAVIVVPSLATATDLQSRYGVAATRVRVTPLAASLPTSARDVGEVLDRLRISRPYVVCPATIEARKNQDRLVRAYRQVAHDLPHVLVLAGPPGWRSEQLETELTRPGPGTVIRTGWLDDADFDAVYRGADAVVYPSRYEGFGLPIVEAMLRGIPVVTSTTPACAETADGAAVLVDPDDVGGLADAIGRVATDEALRSDLVARGTARAAGLSWEATARATLDAYRDAVAMTS